MLLGRRQMAWWLQWLQWGHLPWWGHWSPLEQVVGGTNNNVGSIPRDNNKMDYRCHSAINSTQVLSVMKDPDMFNASPSPDWYVNLSTCYMCVIKRLQWLSGVLKHMLTIAWRYQQTDKVWFLITCRQCNFKCLFEFHPLNIEKVIWSLCPHQQTHQTEIISTILQVMLLFFSLEQPK